MGAEVAEAATDAPDADTPDEGATDEGVTDEAVAPAERAPLPLYEWDGSLPHADVPARDVYALRLVTGRRLYDSGRLVSESPVLQRVRRPYLLHVNPQDASRIGVEPGTEVKVTSARGCAGPGPPRRGCAGRCRPARLLRRRRGRGRTDRRRRDRHRHPRGDDPMMGGPMMGGPMTGQLMAVDPLFNGHVSWSVLGVVVIKVVVAFVILLVSVMLYIWGMRKVIADMQNRIGPNRAGPYGVLQTLADGIKLFFKEQSIPTTADRPVFRLAPLPVDHAGVPDVLHRPDRRHRLDPRAPHVSPGRRSAGGRAVHPRDVGPRRVRRDARRVGRRARSTRCSARCARRRSCSRTRRRSPSRSSACSSRPERSRRTRSRRSRRGSTGARS